MSTQRSNASASLTARYRRKANVHLHSTNPLAVVKQEGPSKLENDASVFLLAKLSLQWYLLAGPQPVFGAGKTGALGRFATASMSEIQRRHKEKAVR